MPTFLSMLEEEMKSFAPFLKRGLVVLLLFAVVGLCSCDKTKWRAKDYDRPPPHYESDFGHPDRW